MNFRNEPTRTEALERDFEEFSGRATEQNELKHEQVLIRVKVSKSGHNPGLFTKIQNRTVNPHGVEEFDFGRRSSEKPLV